jgi:hydrogenase maturation protease
MMNLDRVEKIADAVLYEGYILYPYRPSSVKNQQRWNFGALCPPAYSHAQGGTEASVMQTECLVVGDRRATCEVKVRFLHLVSREVGRLTTTLSELEEGSEPDFQTVAALEVGGRLYQTWQEAVEREVILPDLNLHQLVSEGRRQTFGFPSQKELEPLREPDGQKVGVIVRRQQAIEGLIEVAAELAGEQTTSADGRSLPVDERSLAAGEQLFKLTVRILNLTALEDAGRKSRDEALMRSLVSTHTILGVRGGEFVSLLEPPRELTEVAASCRNVGTWPVLVGEEGAHDLLLSSPIILYDYPQIAPESAGDLFDGTEIDEILTLRIMTLTEEEKREMRGVDERARRILERTETLPVEQLMKLHGAMRSLRPREEDER